MGKVSKRGGADGDRLETMVIIKGEAYQLVEEHGYHVLGTCEKCDLLAQCRKSPKCLCIMATHCGALCYFKKVEVVDDAVDALMINRTVFMPIKVDPEKIEYPCLHCQLCGQCIYMEADYCKAFFGEFKRDRVFRVITSDSNRMKWRIRKEK